MSQLTYHLVQADLQNFEEVGKYIQEFGTLKRLTPNDGIALPAGVDLEAYGKLEESTPMSFEFMSNNFSNLGILGENVIRRPSLVLLFKIANRIMIVTMGDAYHLIDDVIIEDEFGKALGLRWIVPGKIVELDTTRTGKNPKRVRQQVSQPSTVDEFQALGLDTILDAIGGKVVGRKGIRNFKGGHTIRYDYDPSLKGIAENVKELYGKYETLLANGEKIPA